MDFATSIPGFPGLFIAGVFSAALRYTHTCKYNILPKSRMSIFTYYSHFLRQPLENIHSWSTRTSKFDLLCVRLFFYLFHSSMSTNLNSLSGVILQDFIKPCLGRKQMSEETASTTMKLIVVVLGIFCTAMVFLVDKLGAIIQVSRHPSFGFFSITNSARA
jgi:type III secretory pathway component EscS